MTDPAMEEIVALRERLRHLEAIAAATPPPTPLDDSIAAAMSPTQPPPDPARARLVNEAHGWAPDDQMEAAVKARDRDPAAHGAATASMRESGLPLALYERGRAAATALGTFVPPTEGDAS